MRRTSQVHFTRSPTPAPISPSCAKCPFPTTPTSQGCPIANLLKRNETIDGGFDAFEAGTMPAEECGPRLEELGVQLRDLRGRDAELQLAMTDQIVPEVTDEWIAEIHDVG